MSINPFQPTAELPNEKGIFSDGAVLRRAGFLYRVIDFEWPIAARFVYTGWWFRQAVYLNRRRVWLRISWTKIHTQFAFPIPEAFGAAALSGEQLHNGLRGVPGRRAEPRRHERSPSPQRLGQVEINFTRALTIRRFRIWIDAEVVYDEIH